MRWRWNLFLLAILPGCHPLTFLCKTKETFKVAELQWLEAKMNAVTRPNHYYVSKLLVDRATGSTLFALEGAEHCSLFGNGHVSSDAPSSLRKCDWVAQVVASGSSAAELVQSLHENLPGDIQEKWNLAYIRMEDNNDLEKNRPQSFYTKSSLLQSISQALPVPPALDTRAVNQQLFVVDTKSGTESTTCYLTIQQKASAPETPGSFLRKWSSRPFQYSSAINPQIAETVMNILWDMIQDISGVSQSPPFTLLDPSCGSGTFLAVAIQRGMFVEAYDCNRQCVEGSLSNLEFLFPDDAFPDWKSNQLLQLAVHDSTNPFPTERTDRNNINCVVANLPWGINSIDYADQNLQILHSVRDRIRSGTPCAFITRAPELALFAKSGFHVLGQSHVPQRDFILPEGNKKKKKKNFKESEQNVRNHQCVITIARAISPIS